MRGLRGILVVAIAHGLASCAARAQPVEADVVVVSAGAGSPVGEGGECVLRIQPAWRQGVNCQVLLQCGEEDLFGGRRIGGYAVCDYADDAFLSALDEEPRTDGDPALRVDLVAGTLAWRGPGEDEQATLRVRSPHRLAAPW